MQLTRRAIQNISGDALRAVNKAVGFRLFTKFGLTGIINLGTVIPVMGGIVGGILTGIGTYTTGQTGKYLFEN